VLAEDEAEIKYNRPAYGVQLNPAFTVTFASAFSVSSVSAFTTL
jgi:hypothetical protein